MQKYNKKKLLVEIVYFKGPNKKRIFNQSLMSRETTNLAKICQF